MKIKYILNFSLGLCMFMQSPDCVFCILSGFYGKNRVIYKERTQGFEYGKEKREFCGLYSKKKRII